MARFHVYGLKQSRILALDLQSDLLERLRTRMMAPLLRAEEVPMPMARLNPQFTIAGEPYIMATQLMSAISLTEIGELVTDLSSHGDQITAATDFLFQGF
ncbi:CcdB family protein [Rhizobium sp. CNPSo 4062]|uniref:CcdB family protein n=1 Tax=Rhizobium sp. CNPSo 4062 TaxID=3021410 RepID=UPI0025507898|nr:CcdB family protein [Rhizobium sp. CNPSo 4062]MDK4706147.1 CcdB family protein [Rhizobium sp. CNPSo 4062]